MTPAELTAILERLDLSDREAARRWGVHWMTMSRYQRGLREIPLWLERVALIEAGEIAPLKRNRNGLAELLLSLGVPEKAVEIELRKR